MSSLSGKVALVTGARLRRRGLLRGRDTAALSAVRAGIERDGGTAMQVVADVTRFARDRRDAAAG